MPSSSFPPKNKKTPCDHGDNETLANYQHLTISRVVAGKTPFHAFPSPHSPSVDSFFCFLVHLQKTIVIVESFGRGFLQRSQRISEHYVSGERVWNFTHLRRIITLHNDLRGSHKAPCWTEINRSLFGFRSEAFVLLFARNSTLFEFENIVVSIGSFHLTEYLSLHVYGFLKVELQKGNRVL